MLRLFQSWCSSISLFIESGYGKIRCYILKFKYLICEPDAQNRPKGMGVQLLSMKKLHNVFFTIGVKILAFLRCVFRRRRNEFSEKGMDVNMKFVWVEAGDFVMHNSASHGGHHGKNEHIVHVDGFYMGVFPVTQSQWEKVMGFSLYQQHDDIQMDSAANDEKLVGENGADHPRHNVGWEEAMEFCSVLSQTTGKNYTLPSELQWEYAARGGNMSDHSVHHDNNGHSMHHACHPQANALGLYDMGGNVCEWCEDWYDGGSDVFDTDNANGLSDELSDVLDAGGWTSYEQYCRVADRYNVSASLRHSFGFRLVWVP